MCIYMMYMCVCVNVYNCIYIQYIYDICVTNCNYVYVYVRTDGRTEVGR